MKRINRFAVLTIVATVLAQEFESSDLGACNNNCVDKSGIWCANYNFKGGACFTGSSGNLEAEVKNKNKGFYKDCSSHWSKF